MASERRYRVEVAPRAAKSLRSFPSAAQRRIATVIRKMMVNPRLPGSKKLSAAVRNIYRFRVGDYRILYEIRDKVLVVVVIHIGHRKDVYRKR